MFKAQKLTCTPKTRVFSVEHICMACEPTFIDTLVSLCDSLSAFEKTLRSSSSDKV